MTGAFDFVRKRFFVSQGSAQIGAGATPGRKCCVLRLRSALGSCGRRFARFCADRSRCDARQEMLRPAPAFCPRVLRTAVRKVLLRLEQVRRPVGNAETGAIVLPSGPADGGSRGSPQIRAGATPGRKCCALRLRSALGKQNKVRDNSSGAACTGRILWKSLGDCAMIKKAPRNRGASLKEEA